jgi:hypothetical protein
MGQQCLTGPITNGKTVKSAGEKLQEKSEV